MSEWPEGKRVDVHSMSLLGDFDYKDREDGNNFLGDGFSNAHSAAHEQYEGGNDHSVTKFSTNNYRVTQKNKETSCRLSSDSSGGWWAATVASYCPGKMAEHPKLKSTGDFYQAHGSPCN